MSVLMPGGVSPFSSISSTCAGPWAVRGSGVGLDSKLQAELGPLNHTQPTMAWGCWNQGSTSSAIYPPPLQRCTNSWTCGACASMRFFWILSLQVIAVCLGDKGCGKGSHLAHLGGLASACVAEYKAHIHVGGGAGSCRGSCRGALGRSGSLSRGWWTAPAVPIVVLLPVGVLVAASVRVPCSSMIPKMRSL